MPCRATAPPSAAAALLAAALSLAAAGALGVASASAQSSADSLAARAPVLRTPAGWETLATGLPEEARLRFVPGFRYDRVDGATPALGIAFRSERDPDPFVYATAAYATGRDRFLGEAGFEAPLGDPTWLRLGADAYRRTATEDEWIAGEIENTIFALVARTDYRDWYEATGWDGHATVEPGRDVAVTGTIRIQNESSLPTRVRVSLFGKHDRFRSNPPVQAGDEGLLALSLRVGPERLPAEGGTQGTAAYERAGGVLGRDFDYGRARATIRTLHRFSKRSLIRARAIGGSTREGALPAQKIWHVGGIGTLRGHDYKALAGDQFFVANTEYLVRVRKQFFPFAFVDWGAAWFGRGNLERQQPGLDGGAGFLVGENGLAVTVARDLRRSEAPLRVGVRLGASF